MFWLGLGCFFVGWVTTGAAIGLRLGWRTTRAVWAATALYLAIGTSLAVALDQVSVGEDAGLLGALALVPIGFFWPLLVVSALSGTPIFN